MTFREINFGEQIAVAASSLTYQKEMNALLSRLRGSGADVPEIGVDIASDTGRVITQAEVLWKDSAQVILLEREMKNSSVLENMGFTVHSTAEVIERPMGIIAKICRGDLQ